MRVAKLAGPLIFSRLGEMISSFIFLAFVGNFLPDSLGHASFAWAFISLSTVVGIGFFSTLMIDVAGEDKDNLERLIAILSMGVKLACILGGGGVLSVLGYVLFNADSLESLASSGEIVVVLMSLSIPAIYLQIVVFNYFNALGMPRLELMFVWAFNLIFLAAAALCISINLSVSIIYFVLAYVSLRWMLVLIVFVLIRFKRIASHFHINCVASRWVDYKSFLLKGAPLALCFGGESFLYFALAVIAKDMGGLALAAYQSSLHFLSVIYMVSIGVGNATAILTAHPFKENKLSTAKAIFFEGISVGLVLLLPCLLICIYFSDFVAELYSSEAEVRKLIAGNIKAAVLFLLFEYIYVVVRMVLRSLGDSWMPTAYTIFCLNGLGLSMVWLFFTFYGPDIKYLFWSLTLCTFILMAFLVGRLTRIFISRGK